jgi:hypothetical protein
LDRLGLDQEGQAGVEGAALNQDGPLEGSAWADHREAPTVQRAVWIVLMWLRARPRADQRRHGGRSSVSA